MHNVHCHHASGGLLPALTPSDVMRVEICSVASRGQSMLITVGRGTAWLKVCSLGKYTIGRPFHAICSIVLSAIQTRVLH